MKTQEIAAVVSTILEQIQNNEYQPSVYKGFSFRSPAVTSIGGNITGQLGDILKDFNVSHVLLVADKIVYDLGLLKSCEQAIKQAGIRLSVFANISGEPDTKIVSEGIKILKESQADFVLGAGGGSALDTAKAIAVMVDHVGDLEHLKLGGLASRRVGLGAIPTTAGTGSEVTDIAVITDLARNIKVPVKAASLVPDLAILDPNLMLKVPASITAATGIDALTHAIEAYVSIYSNPLSKAYAFHAVETIFKYLPIAVGNGDDLDARYHMAIASYKAGLAFSNAGLGLTHAVAHQIGNIFHIPHGVANAILLTYIMSFNSLTSEKMYAELASAMRVNRDNMTKRELCNASIQAVFQLIKDIDLPCDFSAYEIKKSDLELIAQQAMQDICLAGNPRKVTSAQIVQLLQQIISGQALEKMRNGS